MATTELATVALLALRSQRLALALAPQSRWHDLYGRQMARLEFPSVPHTADAEPQAEALALAQRVFGHAASPLPTRWTYGPSAQHAVDRSPATPATAPFLRFERMLPLDQEKGQPLHLVAIEVYRATLADGSDPLDALDPQTIAAILWLPLAALRLLVSGAPPGEVRAMEGVEIEQARGSRLPDDALLYLPSDYGERHLLRIAAKYGERALFAAPANDV
jgi:hypothetical protein